MLQCLVDVNGECKWYRTVKIDPQELLLHITTAVEYFLLSNENEDNNTPAFTVYTVPAPEGWKPDGIDPLDMATNRL